MTTAKRRINSTGRRRIRRENIDIRMLESGAGEPLKAKAELTLGEHGFPPDSAVAIEAYHRSSGMRFDCGTVGALAIPPLLVLDEVDRSGSVLFRVKVIDAAGDPGKILGSAERIQPASENAEDDRKSLFPVLFRNLGEQVWKVEINEGDRPKLILNREIPGISHQLHQNALLRGLLFPAAFRIVLDELVKSGDDEEDDEPGWKFEWLKYCKEVLGVQDAPPESDDVNKAEWVERVVRTFCEEHKFMHAIRKMEEEAAA